MESFRVEGIFLVSLFKIFYMYIYILLYIFVRYMEMMEEYFLTRQLNAVNGEMDLKEIKIVDFDRSSVQFAGFVSCLSERFIELTVNNRYIRE